MSLPQYNEATTFDANETQDISSTNNIKGENVKAERASAITELQSENTLIEDNSKPHTSRYVIKSFIEEGTNNEKSAKDVRTISEDESINHTPLTNNNKETISDVIRDVVDKILSDVVSREVATGMLLPQVIGSSISSIHNNGSSTTKVIENSGTKLQINDSEEVNSGIPKNSADKVCTVSTVDRENSTFGGVTSLIRNENEAGITNAAIGRESTQNESTLRFADNEETISSLVKDKDSTTMSKKSKEVASGTDNVRQLTIQNNEEVQSVVAKDNEHAYSSINDQNATSATVIDDVHTSRIKNEGETKSHTSAGSVNTIQCREAGGIPNSTATIEDKGISAKNNNEESIIDEANNVQDATSTDTNVGPTSLTTDDQEIHATANPNEDGAGRASEDNQNTSENESNCSICLEPCREKAYADTCLHEFCFTCILQWSQEKPECPLCKRSLTSIIQIGQNGEYIETIVENHQTRNLVENEPTQYNTTTPNHTDPLRVTNQAYYNTRIPGFEPTLSAFPQFHEANEVLLPNTTLQTQYRDHYDQLLLLTCRECGRVYQSISELASHMRAHEREQEVESERQEQLRQQAVRCKECSRICESAAGLASHMRAHAREREVERERQEQLRREAVRCKECGRICESAAGLSSHMRVHAREREVERERQEVLYRQTLSCGECGRVCGSPAGLASHMRAHERNRLELNSFSYQSPFYEPSNQDYAFQTSSSYGSSYRQQEQSYVCGMCGRVCGSGAGLASHMRAHQRR